MCFHPFVQANEVLLGGKKLNSLEALERGLVTKVLPTNTFLDDVNDIVSNLAKLPPKVIYTSFYV